MGNLPLDCLTPEPPDWMTDERRREDWRAAHALPREMYSLLTSRQ
jgi:hypothetical protein